jgi:hypothetical protein
MVGCVYPISRRRCVVASLVKFDIDLTAHEGLRLAAVMDALGPGWDPVEVLTGEAEAHRMLYADLDADQQAAYELLIAAGVVPDAVGVKRS